MLGSRPGGLLTSNKVVCDVEVLSKGTELSSKDVRDPLTPKKK